MKFKDASSNNELAVSRKLAYVKYAKLKHKFKVIDKVRISKLKHVFAKGYTANWTLEMYTIEKVINIVPVTEKLENY